MYVALRNDVLNGTLAPGDPVSTVALARRMHVSRTPVREALSRLQDEGLVTVRAHRRPVVTPFDAEQVDALYAQRMLTEALAARCSSPPTAAARSEITEALAAFQEAIARADLSASEQAHRYFHLALVAGAPPTLRAAVGRLMDATDRHRHWLLKREQSLWLTEAVHEHAVLVEAVESPPHEQVAGLLSRHLARTALMLLARTAPEYEPRAVRTALSAFDSTADAFSGRNSIARNPGLEGANQPQRGR